MSVLFNFVKPGPRLDQSGFIRYGLVIALAAVAIFSGLHLMSRHASADATTIYSGVKGYCLDDYKNQPLANNMVSAWQCNGSAAQGWSSGAGRIIHGADDCLSVKNNSSGAGSPVVADNCDNAAGQVWLRDQSGFFNPNSGQCLSLPKGEVSAQLVLADCNKLQQPDEQWYPSSPTTACRQNGEGNQVACYAEQEWTRWQSGTISHNDLLNTYTDGTAYESWCADFVSYVYKQAGYPFAGAYDGWDENDANNIQNYGFTEHQAGSGYVPKAGDVAFFDYDGGHVEIVASGGRTPTFIYGNSATIDPTTGNGQMKANTITNDGAEGQVVYYLTPNQG